MSRPPRRPDRARAARPREGRRRLALEALEPRLLLSADTAVLGIAPPPPEEQRVDDGLGPDLASAVTGGLDTMLADATTAALATASPTHGAGAIASDVEAPRRELVLVDSGVENFQALVDGLRDASDAARSIEVVVLDAARDGVVQITEALAEREDLDAVHVVSHGDASGLRLGGTTLDATTLDAYREAIGSWGRALDADADLLLYGCNLAAGSDGRALLAELGALTGADVAASDDLTGSAQLGGDWVLEYASGRVDATSVIGADLQRAWTGVLAVGVDATSSGSTTGSSVTVSHTTSGTERLMLVGVSMGNSASNAVQSITYNGVGLGFVGASDAGDVRSEIWQLVAPATGTHDVVVTLLSATGEQTVGVTTFTGVDQTTPLGAFVANAGDPGNATVDVGSAAGELVFDVVALESSVTGLAPGAGQTELWDVFQAADTSGSASVEAGAPTVTMSWTHDSNAWTIAAVPIKPSSATNAAPVLDDSASPALSAQNEDAGAPTGAVGTPVSQLVDFASPPGQVDNVTDADTGALLGIAVTAADTANGSWWYTTDGGSAWNPLGAVGDTSARLLAADAGTRLYFQPAADYNGTVANAITFRAWDRSSGTNADAGVDTSTNGGTTAFSTTTDTASLVVTPVNDDPVVTSGPAPALVENTVAVTSVTATDADGETPTFSITGGADQALFSIDAVTGALSFIAAPDFESPGDVGADNVYEVEVTASDGVGGSTPQLVSVAVTNESDTLSLWLSTDSNVAAPGAAGLPGGWTESDVLELSGPGLAHGATTGGAFSKVIDFARFTVDAADVGALHYVNRDLTVGGGANTFDLRVGDVLVSFLQDETVLAAHTVSATDELFRDDDLLVFRPTAAGDYSDGTFHLLLDGVVSDDLKGVTLVERNTTVGGTQVSAGGFLVIQESSATTSVDLFVPTGVGAGTTGGTTTPLIDLSGLGIDPDRLRGIELIEREVTVGGQTLAAGSILATLNVDDDVSGVAGNNLLVKKNDVFVLNLTSTGVGSTSGTATMFLEGGDVGLDDNPSAENPYALALFDPVPDVSSAPTFTSPAAFNVAEGATIVGTVTAADTDGDTPTFSISGGVDAAAFLIDPDSGALSFATAPDFESPTDSGSDNVYVVDVTADDGHGGTTVQTISVTVTDVNDAPELDHTGLMSLPNIGQDDTNPPGITVAALVASAGGDRITDVDSGAVEGIAIVGADNGNGTWQYSTNGGVTWLDVGNVNNAQARVLSDTASDMLRFVPDPGFSGNATLSLKAWDRSDALPSGTGSVNTNPGGGTSPFSSATQVAIQYVEPLQVLLWLSTSDDVSGSGVAGLPAWSASSVLTLGDPGLSLGAGATAGRVTSVANFDDFGTDVDIVGLHHVNQAVTLSGPGIATGSIGLVKGDMLFVTEANESLSTAAGAPPAGWSNTIGTTAGDIYAFRPASGGDYTSGYFRLVTAGPGVNRTTEIALIETATVVGDTALAAGDLLFTQTGNQQQNQIYWYRTALDTDVNLVDGGDIGIPGGGGGTRIDSLDLVQSNFTTGGFTFQAGDVLVGFDKTVAAAGSGANAVTAYAQDLVRLRFTDTTLGAGTAVAAAETLFDGDGNAKFDTAAENLDAAALLIVGTSANVAPLVTLPGGTLAYTEGDGAVLVDAAATVGDIDSSGLDTGILRVDLTVNGSPDDRLAIRNEGNLAGQIGVAGNVVSYGGVPIGTVAGGTDGETPLLVTLNASATPAAAEALLRNLTYENPSLDPSTAPRTLRVLLSDGDGATSSPTGITINVTDVNDPPVAADDAYAVDEDGTLVVGPPDGNLASAWTMDEGAGQTLTDGGALGTDGTLGATTGAESSDPAWTTGRAGTAGLAFDGSDDFVSTGNLVAKTASDFTLSAWFQADTTTGQRHILWQGYAGGNGFGDPAGTLASSEMHLSVGSYNQDDKIVFFLGYDVPANGADPIYIVSASDFTDTTDWHHVAVTVSDLGGGVFQAWLYVDGVLQGTDTGTENDRSAWGEMLIGKPGANTRHFDGKLDEVRIYDAPLSQAAIQGIANAGVLGNDSDTDDRLLGVDIATVTGPANGTLSINADGSFVYTPDPDFNGVDSFTYRASDGTADSNVATVTITVNPVNDAPTITDGATVVLGGTDEDTTSSGTAVSTLLTGAAWSDVDAGALQGVAITAATGNGTWQYSTDGIVWNGFGSVSGTGALLLGATSQVRYVPDGLEGEVAAFAFRAWDRSTGTASTNATPGYANPGAGGGSSAFSSESAGASMTVTHVNDAPTVSLANVTVSLPEDADTTSAIKVADIVVADDTQGTNALALSGADAALFEIVGLELRLKAGTNLDFESDAALDVTVEVDDAALPAVPEDSASAAITVTDANDVPVITSGAAPAIAENTTAVTTVTAADEDGDTPTFAITGGADQALFTIDATTGALAFVAPPDFEAPGDVGADNVYEVEITADDGAGGLATQLVSVTVTDANDAPVITSGAGPVVAENTTAVSTVTAADEDGDTPTFSITGGADQALFTLDATTGALAFVAPPDFEAPGDAGADNVYEVEITANDGAGGLTAQLLSVTVTDVNEGPVVTSGASPVIAENTTAVTTVTATDPDGDTPTFSITGGPDQALFTLDATTGALAFVAPPDFEAPGDVGADNIYEVEITADDGAGGLATQLLSVTVTDANDAPVITSGAGPVVAENTTAVTTVTASDPDGDTPTFSITGGADQALFTLDATTGALAFVAPPDFEAPGDVGADNVYEVEVTADDGVGGLTAQLVSVTVANVNEAPAITSGAAPVVAENTMSVTTVTATDPDGDTPTFSITGGPDQALFTLDATTGALAFVASPDFEAPGDVGADNVYEVEITANDGAGGLATQLLSVTVTDANDAPVVTSGAGPVVAENTTAVTTVTATDPDGDTPSFSITGGADQALFTLDATTGALAFVAPPDFEAPGDVGADNVYEVEITADDGAGGLATQLVSVTVTDANDAPVVTSGAGPVVAENTTAVTIVTATDPDGDTPTFSITGGADQALFTLDATTGALAFVAPPDFEAPGDVGADNVYEVQVTAGDGVGGLTPQLLSVTVTDVNEGPVVTSGASPVIAENTTAVTTVTATDPDGDTPTFSITGGPDQALFTLDATTGALTFVAPPDFEAPGDVGADNVYEVEITANDGAGGLATQLLSVTVTDANDAPVVTSGAAPVIAENTTAVTTVTATDPDGDTPTFSITGGADQALFTLDATTGALAFVAPPDFEAPGDVGADNVYEVEVTADDGVGGLTAQLVSVTVANLNEAPAITSGAAPVVAENTMSVTTVTATDPDGDTPTFSITGGPDQALFTIDATTGALAFVAPPDFEAPGDVGADNVYEVEITANDGAGGLATQLLSVTVTDANDAPVVTSGAGPVVAENTTAVTTVTATDPDGDTPSFSITGGADQALFTLDATTGALAFVAPPDFEAPGDVGADNVYEVEITADDGAGGLATQLLLVTVTDANDAPVITSGAAPVIAENTTAVSTVTAADEDGDTPTFAITGGADQALFTLDATTGALAFVAPPDFEAPGDVGADNVYEVEITADDGAGGLATQLVSVTVTDANDAPVITSGAGPVVAENTTAVTTVTASDEDGDTPTFSITGGADQALFTLDATTGALAFVAPPDFETPGDVGADNVYEVEITANDGAGGLTAQLLSVTVTDANDAPVVTSGAGPVVAENTTAVTTVTASDEDGDTPSFSITGGADQALFTLDATTGALAFVAPPDFETPGDVGADNVYEVQVTAGDGAGGLTPQLLSVTVTDVNETPSITSGAAPVIAENTTAVTTVTAADEDGDTPTFSITGGADQALFGIDATTGALTFVAPPDFEAPGDVGADNVYEVEITANDGAGGLATQLLSVTVTDANDAPVVTSGAAPVIAENTTAVTTVTATDPDGDTPSFSITGGPDQALFTLDATTGALTFVAPPDFEAPGDVGADNVYDVEITADDGAGGLATQLVSVTVTDANDAPVITSGAGPVVAENTTAVTTVTASDEDGDTPTFSITGGADQALFTLDATTGALAFVAPPDFETPGDVGADNVYEVQVTAGDGAGGLTPQLLSVTVTDVNETPSITSGAAPVVAENTTAVTTVTATDPDGDTPTFAITGGADQALFTLDATTGALAFVAPPDFEAPGDVGADNVYEVEITANDGAGGLTAQLLSVTVTDANDAPVVTSGAAPVIAENTTAVTTATATDPDGDTPTFSVTGGADQALFTIDATTGALAFVAPPDFEAPGDVGADNVYEVEITADDGAGGLATQLLSVTVTDANDAPIVTSGASPAIAENTASVTTVTATDPDGQIPTFAITGGADQALFSIDTLTGALRFVAPPDFESPGDAGADNVYEVEVTADDGLGGLTAQFLSVTISDVGDTPADESAETPDPGPAPEPAPLPGPLPEPSSGPSDPADPVPGQATDEDTGEIADARAPRPDGGPSASGLDAISDDTLVEAALGLLADPPGTRDDASRRDAASAEAPAVDNADPYIVLLQLQSLDDAGMSLLDLEAIDDDSRAQIPLTMANGLDRMKEEMLETQEESRLRVDRLEGLGAAFGVGFVHWLLRTGAMVGSFVASMPVWMRMDPLPVLKRRLDDAHPDADLRRRGSRARHRNDDRAHAILDAAVTRRSGRPPERRR